MSEANLWNTLRTKMIPDYWKEATRHEDAYQKGIADVSFVQQVVVLPDPLSLHGWMELKWVARWPVRASTIVRIPHYTDEQRRWLMKKGDAGGMTFLFLKIQTDYLLFDHRRAQHVGQVNSTELLSLANHIMYRRFDPESLRDAIIDYGGYV